MNAGDCIQGRVQLLRCTDIQPFSGLAMRLSRRTLDATVCSLLLESTILVRIFDFQCIFAALMFKKPGNFCCLRREAN